MTKYKARTIPVSDEDAEILNRKRSQAHFLECVSRAAQDEAHPAIKNKVAEYFEDGKFFPPDPKQAFTWYRFAAKEGSPHALRKLGDCFRFGLGTRRNCAEAIACYTAAAAVDWAPAIYELGRCFELGDGVSRDVNTALIFFRRADSLGNKVARDRIAALAGKKSKAPIVAPPPVEPDDEDELDDDATEDGDDEITFANIVGNCCFHSTIRELLQTDPGIWFRRMVDNYPNVCPFPLTKSQKGAWSNCRSVLDRACRRLLEIDPRYANLDIVFEYVMPKKNPSVTPVEENVGIRCDAIIVSSETVISLEFKRFESIPSDKKLEKQADKYRRRLKHWHVESAGLTKKALYVLTKAKRIDYTKGKVRICSPDVLADAIHDCFHYAPSRIGSITKWLVSEWRVRR